MVVEEDLVATLMPPYEVEEPLPWSTWTSM
jgi:hypothetical protein